MARSCSAAVGVVRKAAEEAVASMGDALMVEVWGGRGTVARDPSLWKEGMEKLD